MVEWFISIVRLEHSFKDKSCLRVPLQALKVEPGGHSRAMQSGQEQ